jgi:hypothetical protein
MTSITMSIFPCHANLESLNYCEENMNQWQKSFCRHGAAAFMLAAAAIGNASAAAADKTDPNACLLHTFSGSLGTIPVNLEFQERSEDIRGRYYYRTTYSDLYLVQDAKTKRWQESGGDGKSSGSLVLQCAGDKLSGSWTSADGKKTLPLTASVADVGAKKTYDEKRFAAASFKTLKASSVAGKRYETFTQPQWSGVIGLRLLDKSEAVSKINALLMEDFHTSLNDTVDCAASGFWDRGPDAGYENNIGWTPRAWNAGFVVIEIDADGYCGGAHPYHGSSASTYNLKTGAKEDVKEWLQDKYRADIAPDTPLGKLLTRISGRDAQEGCEEAISWSGTSVWPLAEGLAFQPWAPHSMSSCIEEIVVPYKTVMAYLSPYGKAQVQAFIKH